MRAVRLTVKRHKYGARATVVDGIRFASQKEARRYQALKLRLKAGNIREFVLQPEFDLCVWSGDHSDIRTIGKYRGDFQYEECDHANGHRGWRTVVEDVKGFKTPLYRWKKKHVEAQYGVEIREV